MDKNCFPRGIYSISEKEAFFAAICSKIRANGANFLVSARSNALGRARLGMCVSKKVVASAVARNAIKRRIRESFRVTATELLAGFDIVVRVKSKPCDERVELDRLWKKLKKSCRS